MRAASTKRRAPALLATLVLLFGLLAGLLPSAAVAGATHAYVVQAGSAERAAALVVGAGGEVQRELEVIGGVAATLPTPAADALDALGGVAVAPDVEVALAATDAAPTTTDEALSAHLDALNLPDHWTSTDGRAIEAGSGFGVGVALLDTGVADHPDLAGRVIDGPDLSDEAGTGREHLDSYGHGTFMAGLIAADGPVPGAAPGAHIVSVKLAGRDGVTSLSRVIEGIGWVITDGRDEALNVRVLNLSFGVPTNLAPQADPLAAAVQAAWAAGIVVVAATGNDGEGMVTSPARDPWILAVGATDNDLAGVPDWSGRARVGRALRPDVLAPGVSVASLRAAGSAVDTANPSARIALGDAEPAYFRGSGTSMSTALVSGAAAVLAESRPYATPDDLKAALVRTGVPVAGSAAPAVDVAAADAAEGEPGWNQRHPILAPGLRGSLMPWAARGAPGPEATWQRARWAQIEAARARWAEAVAARARWAEVDVQRARWADLRLTRARWAEVDLQRARWADSSFARARWAQLHPMRARWAEADWARARWAAAGDADAWLRARWAARGWDPATS